MAVDSVDWGFWVMYLIPLTFGVVAGWWLRGIAMEDRARDEAKRWHPATRTWTWDDE